MLGGGEEKEIKGLYKSSLKEQKFSSWKLKLWQHICKIQQKVWKIKFGKYPRKQKKYNKWKIEEKKIWRPEQEYNMQIK